MLFSANRRAFVAGLSSTLIGLSLDPASAAAKAKMKYDTDNDGTLDLAEVKKAGAALFAKLDPDHDGTLDARELRSRLSAKELAAADLTMTAR